MATRSVGELATDYSALNLGCGRDYQPDAWNVDVSPSVDPDEVVDLQDTPWSWPDNAFETIHARHVLEHLDPVPFSEVTRVLAPGGTLILTYPIGHTRFEDPTHRQYWNWHTAAAIAGERKHGHEHCEALHLDDQRLEWASTWHPIIPVVWLSLWLVGPGAWLGQMPGVCGEVTARYTCR